MNRSGAKMRVAIVGRPNVGKSTLFNRLTGTRQALVANEAGVTRDWQVLPARISGFCCEIMDTAGLHLDIGHTQDHNVQAVTKQALQQADCFLLMFDATEGVTVADLEVANYLRPLNIPIIILGNKSDKKGGVQGALEGYQLGFDEVVAISAEHAKGLDELAQVLMRTLSRSAGQNDTNPTEMQSAGEMTPSPVEEEREALRITVVGRPNMGKSTLVNALLGERRQATGEQAGLTRDAVEIPWQYRGQSMYLVDTAGLRKRGKITDKVEKFSVIKAREAIQKTHAVILVVDANLGLEKQDLSIANFAIESGKILVIAHNKWDLVQDKKAVRREMTYRLRETLPQIDQVPIVEISALKQQNFEQLLKKIQLSSEIWRKRIATPQLNQWLIHMLEAHPPPLVGGRRVKIRYMTQTGTAPPHFLFWVNRARSLPESYLRYLRNGLRRDFSLPGIPLRLSLRQGHNPYADKKS